MNPLPTLNTALQASQTMDRESDQILGLLGRSQTSAPRALPAYPARSRRRDRARRNA